MTAPASDGQILVRVRAGLAAAAFDVRALDEALISAGLATGFGEGREERFRVLRAGVAILDTLIGAGIDARNGGRDLNVMIPRAAGQARASLTTPIEPWPRSTTETDENAA